VRQITAVTFRVLKREHLHFKEQAERWAIRFRRERVPEIQEEVLMSRAGRPLSQLQERGLQSEVDLLHDFGNERLLRAEIMQQHPRAGADRGRQGTKGEVSYPVAEEIAETFLKKGSASVDVTTVT